MTRPRLQYIAIGLSDGIVLPLAVAAGFTAASAPPVWTTGAAVFITVAGSITMGVASYRTYKQELKDSGYDGNHKSNPHFMPMLDLDVETEVGMKRNLESEMKIWRSQALAGEKPVTPDSLVLISLSIAGSYFAGALLVLFPFFLFQDKGMIQWIPFLFSMILMFITGLLRGFYAGGIPWHSALRSLATGVLAISAAILLGWFFRA